MEKQMFMAIGVVGLVLAGLSSAYADIPLMINHQGLVKVDGFPFDGTGYFRFAIVDPDTGNNVWTNDGTKLVTSQAPTSSVNLPVVKGSYNVRLGDVSISNMTAIPSTVFDDDNVVLRVWFSDGTHGTEQLEPDQVITSAGYAYHAAKADDADTLGGQDASALVDVPSGFCVLGDSPTPPAGYTYTGLRVQTVSRWLARQPMPTGRGVLVAMAVNGIIYAIGGQSSASSYETANEAHDPVTNSWTTKEPMPTGRYNMAGAVANGMIYVIGGSSNSNSHETVMEAYDPTTDNWITGLDPMPTGRRHLAAAAVGEIICAIGGDSSSASFVQTNEEYNVAADSWASKTPMPTGRAALGAAALGGKLYAIGGSAGGGGATANEIYNPVSELWDAGAPLPTGRYALAVVAVESEDLIYAVGGAVAEKVRVNEVYHRPSDSWSVEASMPKARANLGASAVNGVLYTVGGQSSTSNYETTNEAYGWGFYVHRKD